MPFPLDLQFLESQLQHAKDQNKRIIIDALIYNENGEIFAQKRSPQRLKHPNCWDLPGGHLDEGETLLEGLVREVEEELSSKVEAVEALLDITDFVLDESMLKDGEAAEEKIFQFLVKLQDNKNIVLEEGKATEYAWFNRENVDITLENRTEVNNVTYIKDAVLKALDYLEKRNYPVTS